MKEEEDDNDDYYVIINDDDDDVNDVDYVMVEEDYDADADIEDANDTTAPIDYTLAAPMPMAPLKKRT